jgi:hypothetical protein
MSDVPERVRQIAMLRGLGYSYRQIAGPLHVTPQAVSLMLMSHRRSLKSLRDAIRTQLIVRPHRQRLGAPRHPHPRASPPSQRAYGSS